MQKTGQVERTVDREFLDEEAKYKVSGHLHAELHFIPDVTSSDSRRKPLPYRKIRKLIGMLFEVRLLMCLDYRFIHET